MLYILIQTRYVNSRYPLNWVTVANEVLFFGGVVKILSCIGFEGIKSGFVEMSWKCFH